MRREVGYTGGGVGWEGESRNRQEGWDGRGRVRVDLSSWVEGGESGGRQEWGRIGRVG